MRIVLRGNHMPDWDEANCARFSTEWHLGESLRLLGHDVVRIQEDRDDWVTTIKACTDADLFMWVMTTDYARRWRPVDALDALAVIGETIPTVGVHLDRWWGLNRQDDIFTEPFFKVRYLFTADGDNPDRWRDANVNHFWLPPGVFGPECVPGTPNPEWASDAAFVGSWSRYSHPEHWPARHRMLNYAKERWGEAVQFWPREGRGAVRSHHLNNLLASVKVVLGDSALASTSTRYWSDRVPETIGRGGFLVMQAIPGLVEQIPDGMGVAYYPPDDLDRMGDLVDWWRTHDAEREEAVNFGQQYVRQFHSYEVRMQSMLDTLTAEGAFG